MGNEGTYTSPMDAMGWDSAGLFDLKHEKTSTPLTNHPEKPQWIFV